jgi:type II secretory pathway pseudopilin PulG
MRFEPSPHIQRQKYLFTILELVLVIAVITILVSSLLPSVMVGKGSAYRSMCTYNLHSVGVAMQGYGYDNTMYPLADPVISTLMNDQYLSAGQLLHCSLDSSSAPDTYSSGYVGGHPNSMNEDDPLVVCGWHPDANALTVFSDTSVTELCERTGASSIPVTATYNGDPVDPGFTLQAAGFLSLVSAAGDQAMLFGQNGTSYVAATYNPSVGNGGAFEIVTGFQTSSATPQLAQAISQQPITMYSRFEFSSLRYRSIPVSTSLQWRPGSSENEVTISLYDDYEIKHRVTGETDNSNAAQVQSKYEVELNSLEKQ